MNTYILIERNDQESIQLPNKTPKGKKDVLKATASQSKHIKQKSQKDSFFTKNGQRAIQNKNNSPGHTCKDVQ